MDIIPAINCSDINSIEDRLKKSGEIFNKKGIFDPWVQIDIADGSFTEGYTTWQNFSELDISVYNFNFEAHIMSQEPMELLKEALEAGFKRIIVHIESDIDFEEARLHIQRKRAKLVLATNPETKLKALLKLLDDKIVDQVLLLSVRPGLSGQTFQAQVLDKIKKLRSKQKNLLIEVDGGINPGVARECREAGADQVAVGSYLFNEADISKAYTKLQVA